MRQVGRWSWLEDRWSVELLGSYDTPLRSRFQEGGLLLVMVVMSYDNIVKTLYFQCGLATYGSAL